MKRAGIVHNDEVRENGNSINNQYKFNNNTKRFNKESKLYKKTLEKQGLEISEQEVSFSALIEKLKAHDVISPNIKSSFITSITQITNLNHQHNVKFLKSLLNEEDNFHRLVSIILNQQIIKLPNISSMLSGAGEKASEAFENLHKALFNDNGNGGYIPSAKLQAFENSGVKLSNISSMLNGAGSKASEAFENLHKVLFDDNGEGKYTPSAKLQVFENSGVTLQNISSMLSGAGSKASEAFENLHKVLFDDNGNDVYTPSVKLTTLLNHSNGNISTILKHLHYHGANAAEILDKFYNSLFNEHSEMRSDREHVSAIENILPEYSIIPEGQNIMELVMMYPNLMMTEYGWQYFNVIQPLGHYYIDNNI